jgi:hypothetical protein
MQVAFAMPPVHKMLRILFTVAAIAVYKQKYPHTLLCKHNACGDISVYAWLMLTRLNKHSNKDAVEYECYDGHELDQDVDGRS